jgi:hypothetical protein
MSQQAAAGRSGGHSGGCSGKAKPRYFLQMGELKGFKSAILEIACNTFNRGQNKFTAQFTQSQKNVMIYLQCTAALEGYLVAEMVHTSKKQVIKLPVAIDPSNLEYADKIIIRAKEVKTIAKRRLKLKTS